MVPTPAMRTFALRLGVFGLCGGVLMGSGRGGGGAPGSPGELRAAIDSMISNPKFSNAHWGILIVDPERGDTLFSRNAGKLFMPASNMKILTSATVLDRLGPEYRYCTSLARRGPLPGGPFAGDLVVVGRGDPSVSNHMQPDAMLPLRAAAES